MTWDEMVTDAFMQGKKLPKEIIDTNNNQILILSKLDALQ